MQSLSRKATRSTPHVSLDIDSGVFVIAGRSIPEDAESFYRPILDWVEEYKEKVEPRRINLHFHFDFFNIASSKRILFILYKMVQLREAGFVILVNWAYDEQDVDMHDIGLDYASMIPDLSFAFHKVSAPKMEPIVVNQK